MCLFAVTCRAGERRVLTATFSPDKQTVIVEEQSEAGDREGGNFYFEEASSHKKLGAVLPSSQRGRDGVSKVDVVTSWNRDGSSVALLVFYWRKAQRTAHRHPEQCRAVPTGRLTGTRRRSRVSPTHRAPPTRRGRRLQRKCRGSRGLTPTRSAWSREPRGKRRTQTNTSMFSSHLRLEFRGRVQPFPKATSKARFLIRRVIGSSRNGASGTLNRAKVTKRIRDKLLTSK